MMLKKISLPVQLVAIIAAVILFGSYLPLSFIRASYTFSLAFKELLGWVLPFVIFSFVVTGITSLKKNAPAILAVLLGLIFASNGIIACITYVVGRLILPALACDVQDAQALRTMTELEPYRDFTFSLPQLMRSEHALVLAIIVGCVLSYVHIPAIERAIAIFKRLIGRFVTDFFIPLLPIYVLGFLLEMQYKQLFIAIMRHYGATFVLIVSVQIVLLILYYILAARGSLQRAWVYMGNALPSYITAFFTMSSTATVPVSIACAEKNIESKPLAELSMPIMANIHLTGDSIGTPLLALVTSSLFLGTFPGATAYLIFVCYFCLAMLAVSGIPGGGIIVMTPVLISQFGFTQEMIGIITTLYLLLDSFGTAANVMGDGALIIIAEKLLKKLRLL
jgi:Na+/H+-dicarboxylate symporter